MLAHIGIDSTGHDVEHAGGQLGNTLHKLRAVCESGAVRGGFTMTALPASSAWGRAAARIATGQLKGTMMVTTPKRLIGHRGC